MTTTPGPWKATELASGLWNVHQASQPPKPPIAALDFSPDDARLISACPEMLAFIKKQFANTNCICKGAMGRVQAMIGTDLPCSKCEAEEIIHKTLGASPSGKSGGEQ